MPHEPYIVNFHNMQSRAKFRDGRTKLCTREFYEKLDVNFDYPKTSQRTTNLFWFNFESQPLILIIRAASRSFTK